MPVIPISAAKAEGIEELIQHAIHVAKYQEKPLETDFCRKEEGVHRGIHAVMHLIEDHAEKAEIPVRFAASKIMEGDEKILEQLNLTENEKNLLEDISRQTEEETGLDRAAAIAQMRFAYIEDVCSESVIKPKESREHLRSRKIDRFLTGKYTGIPAFVGIMAVVFWLTFNVIGAFLQGLLESGITALTNVVDHAMTAAHVNSVVHSLVIDGIFSGVGGVLSFLPIIVTLFFFLSLLEDSGYMARVAFIMDKLLRKLGLSGRSIVPMLVGFGCTVPGVMASRTLPSERDRKMTILLTPFMSCTAKLPIYAFFTAAFFPKRGALVMIGLYVFGIVMGILMALIFKKTAFKGEAVPFVMELPNYRLPGAKNVGHLLWDKAKDFLQRAFTVIFIATIVIWFLQNFDTRRTCADFPSCRIWRLAYRDRADFGISGKRKRCIVFDYFVWKQCSTSGQSYHCRGSSTSRILPALYAMCRSNRVCETGIGRKMGSSHGIWSMFHCMDCIICSLSHRRIIVAVLFLSLDI